jgi:DNA-directed RNA polymerase subunit RPC12/RpoP
MAKGIYYCEECVEDISASDVFWEGGRPYCGRCGSELDMDEDTADVVEHISSRRMVRPTGTDYDDEDELDDDDGEEEGDELDENEEGGEDQDEDEDER